MARIITNGCFDVFHENHKIFLSAAAKLGNGDNYLVVFVNDDASAKALKSHRHGEKYPIDTFDVRMKNIRMYVSEANFCPTIIVGFSHEFELERQIRHFMPCILVKGNDYKGKKITGENIAPVLILDTPPDSEEVKQMKAHAYAVEP